MIAPPFKVMASSSSATIDDLISTAMMLGHIDDDSKPSSSTQQFKNDSDGHASTTMHNQQPAQAAGSNAADERQLEIDEDDGYSWILPFEDPVSPSSPPQRDGGTPDSYLAPRRRFQEPSRGDNISPTKGKNCEALLLQYHHTTDVIAAQSNGANAGDSSPLDAESSAVADHTGRYRDQDIICGRHKIAFNHIGNRRFRISIGLYLPRYLQDSSRKARSNLTKEIIQTTIKSGVRFFKYDKKNATWVELEGKEMGTKVGHALRDAAAKFEKHKTKAQEQTHTIRKREANSSLPAAVALTRVVVPEEKDEEVGKPEAIPSSPVASFPSAAAKATIITEAEVIQSVVSSRRLAKSDRKQQGRSSSRKKPSSSFANCLKKAKDDDTSLLDNFEMDEDLCITSKASV